LIFKFELVLDKLEKSETARPTPQPPCSNNGARRATAFRLWPLSLCRSPSFTTATAMAAARVAFANYLRQV
jgi:hypothetical protein